MSGFLIAARPFSQVDWGARLAFSPAAHPVQFVVAPWTGTQSLLGAPELWAAASDHASGVSLTVVGRLAFDEAAWQKAQHAPSAGGLAARLLLEHWLKQPRTLTGLMNGVACVLIHEPAHRRLHLITDRMGAFPVYADGDTPTALCSHPDVLADFLAAGDVILRFDRLTFAEVLHGGASVHPHTYYEGIRQLDAATHYVIDLSDSPRPMRRECYWSPPRESADGSSTEVQAEAFANAVLEAGQRRSARLGKNGLLLSGGADSRALLFAMETPSQVEALTFCDCENPEVDAARAVAAAAGAAHHVLFRAFEHYGDGAEETIRVTGGMWSLKDAHYQGFSRQIDALQLGNLMTGCYTDYLYKGLAYNRRERRVFGKRLSLDERAPYAEEYYQPHSRLAPIWEVRVAERSLAWMGEGAIARYDYDPFAVEDKRIRPLSREADAMGRLYLLRTQPWDPVMIDNALIDLYGRIPPSGKLNARVFRAAVARLLPPAARSILNNNDHSPIGASETQRVLRYLWHKSLLIASRRLRGEASEAASVATPGSWPNFRHYVSHSQRLAEHWARPTRAQRALFADLLGADPFMVPLDTWARRDIDLILRLITLKLWLDQRPFEEFP